MKILTKGKSIGCQALEIVDRVDPDFKKYLVEKLRYSVEAIMGQIYIAIYEDLNDD